MRVNTSNLLLPLQRWDSPVMRRKYRSTPKTPGAPMGKVPLPVFKELEHQARQNISTLNFTFAFAKTSSTCNATLEKCQHSLKSTFKRVKSQIQKGVNPEKAAKRGYELACEYLDLWNKTVLIQHRALTCLCKSLAHILQRELYSMGNTGLLRREAEMTLLQPHLGETRLQELRNSPFWHSSLFKSQPVKEGEDFLLKKGTSKDFQGFGPYQQKRLLQYKACQKYQALATCIQSLLSKNAIERVENIKSLGFYSRLLLVPKPDQRWRPVIDLSRLITFLHIEKFKMETPESIRTSLVPGEWVSSTDLSDAYLHIPIHPNSRKCLRFCHRSQVFQFTSLPFGLATASPGLYNDCNGGEANGPFQRTRDFTNT